MTLEEQHAQERLVLLRKVSTTVDGRSIAEVRAENDAKMRKVLEEEETKRRQAKLDRQSAQAVLTPVSTPNVEKKEKTAHKPLNAPEIANQDTKPPESASKSG